MLYGIFVLNAADQPPPLDKLALSYVKGAVLRTTWDEIEITKGVFTWTYLDNALQDIVDAGITKPISLGIAYGGTIGVPSWLAAEGVEFFSYSNEGVTNTVPIFWDETFMLYRDRYITEFITRYKDHPLVTNFHISGLNSKSGDWWVPSDAATVSYLLSHGYTTNVAIDCVKQAIDAAFAVTGDFQVRMSVGNVALSYDNTVDVNYVAQTAIAYAQTTYPSRFYPQKSAWAATTPFATSSSLQSWVALKDALPYTAVQALWFINNDATYRMNGRVADTYGNILTKALTAGLTYPIPYYEIYDADIGQSWATDILTAHAATLETLFGAIVDPIPNPDPEVPVDPPPVIDPPPEVIITPEPTVTFEASFNLYPKYRSFNINMTDIRKFDVALQLPYENINVGESIIFSITPTLVPSELISVTLDPLGLVAGTDTAVLTQDTLGTDGLIYFLLGACRAGESYEITVLYGTANGSTLSETLLIKCI